jgi:hypothetical protein
MTEPFARVRRAELACWGAAIAALLLSAQTARAAETISIRLDQARISRLPDRVSTIVIGNPLIADVSLQAGGLMVLTGKGYGITNLIALDRNGDVLTEQSILVQGPSDGVVVVYRGPARESYSCTPRCEERITLGDNNTFFNSTMTQAGNRSSRAQGAASAAGGPGGGGAPSR